MHSICEKLTTCLDDLYKKGYLFLWYTGERSSLRRFVEIWVLEDFWFLGRCPVLSFTTSIPTGNIAHGERR
jgi:hypothetical protein